MTPEQLSVELRTGVDTFLTCRRWIVGLSLVSAGLLAFIALFQMGIIRHLPDPPLPRLDSDRVDSSRAAYGRFSIPDGFLGLLMYGVTAGLAAMGGRDRPTTWSWIVFLMAGKILFDAVNSTKLTFQSWHDFRAFCGYCLAINALSLAVVPLAIPETWAAIRHVLGR